MRAGTPLGPPPRLAPGNCLQQRPMTLPRSRRCLRPAGVPAETAWRSCAVVHCQQRGDREGGGKDK